MADGGQGPYRMPAPDPHDLVAFPESFGTRFLLFVDVEEEFDWNAPLEADNRSTSAIRAFPEAHRRFADYGVAPVCMVTHPIATDPAAVDILAAALNDGRTAIGAQLHTWVTPPLAPRRAGDTFGGNLSPAEEAAKLDTLTDAILTAFGAKPIVFRAGRYGIGPATPGLLAQRGYRFDSSVRARYDYTHQGGPDFTKIPPVPYRLGSVIELPLSTAYNGLMRSQGPNLHPALGRIPHALGLFSRMNLLRRVALTPEDMPIAKAIAAVDALLAAGTPLLTFSFHSPSLEPGHTPYVRDATDLAHFWEWWGRMFAHLAARNVRSATLDEVDCAVEPKQDWRARLDSNQRPQA